MSHPPELIEMILDQVRSDYDSDAFRFLIEKPIQHTRRMLPDIQVVDLAGKVICAVEIGYTRPEKLTAYREELKLPDVRWYDKEGKLHTPLERVSTVRMHKDVVTSPGLMFWVVDYWGRDVCDKCWRAYVVAEIVDKQLGPQPDNVSAIEDEAAWSTAIAPWNDLDDAAFWKIAFSDEHIEVTEKARDAIAQESETRAFSNGVRVGCVVSCDICGESRHGTEGDEGITYDFEDFMDLVAREKREYPKSAHQMPLDELAASIDQGFGLTIEYGELARLHRSVAA